ncbi:MAG: metallophosphoesterase [bacterium]|nr:metallophosphoesterase [bacterium]
MTVRYAIVGDIHGMFESLAATLESARGRWGRLDFVLAVGDVEPNRNGDDSRWVVGPERYRKLGDFPRVVNGEIRLGCSLYFIAGNHEPYTALERAGPGEWAPGVWWLGRSGVTIIKGVAVGYLSGIYSPKYSELPEPYRRGPKQKTYWHRSELAHLVHFAQHLPHRLDVLLTHDWPAGVGTDRRGRPVGDVSLRDLTAKLQPRVHACGHMHYDHRGQINNTQVVCLAKPSPGPELRGIVVVEHTTPAGLRILE